LEIAREVLPRLAEEEVKPSTKEIKLRRVCWCWISPTEKHEPKAGLVVQRRLSLSEQVKKEKPGEKGSPVPRMGRGTRIMHEIFAHGRVEEVEWRPEEKKWTVRVKFDSGEERIMKEDDPDLHLTEEYKPPTPPKFVAGSLVSVNGQTGTVERLEWAGKATPGLDRPRV
jgi:hypothetical protein